ncbi:hypothetical protein L596_007527 [Steinernema carpocapsae]|uniref:3'-5' exonuclease domain-containing protein n=1 Tax=Steinernema carpocapsae TaxID=34508 RepID=A0A4V6A619_STECR|nr:hypothetical protein L596_007527 [Steinernema carpocapsae]
MATSWVFLGFIEISSASAASVCVEPCTFAATGRKTAEDGVEMGVKGDPDARPSPFTLDFDTTNTLGDANMGDSELNLKIQSTSNPWKQEDCPDYATFEEKILTMWRRFGAGNFFVEREVMHMCAKAEAPLHTMLKLSEKASALPSGGKTTSLLETILKSYDRMLHQDPKYHASHDQLLNRWSQDKAMAVMFKCGLDKTIETFQKLFKFDDLSMPIDKHIRKAMDRGEFLMAGKCIVHFKLQDKFDVEEILTPLYLLQHMLLIDSYLIGRPKDQRAFVGWLDSLMDATMGELKKIVRRFPGIPESAVEAIRSKNVDRQSKKIIKRFNLSQEVAPRSQKSTYTLSLRHVHVQLCRLHEIEIDQYLDHVQYAMQSSKDLQAFYVSYLIKSHDFVEAARWALFSDLNHHFARGGKLSAFREQATDFVEYLKQRENYIAKTSPTEPYEHKSNTIEFVADMAKLRELTELLRGTRDSVIAIDSEYRPLYITGCERVALLQLAVNGRVFLVDTLMLQNAELATAWKDFFEVLFTDESNLKLGFAFSGDIKVITSSSPVLTDLGRKMKRVGCLVPLVQALLKKQPNLIKEFGNDERGIAQFSLKDLTKAVTGRRMKKTEQRSNWDRRPLRKEQMDYAAMDVITVIEIYDKLKKAAESEHINFEECVNACILRGPSKLPTKLMRFVKASTSTETDEKSSEERVSG